MPFGEIITKEAFDESEIEYEEGGSTVIPAHDIGGKPQMNPIAKILQRNKKSTHTPLEILAKDCNCSVNKKHGYIKNNITGLFITPKMLFEYQGLASHGNVRCPLSNCLEPMSWDLLLYHFEDHKLSLDKVSKLFAREFYRWEYQDSKFRYLGERIEA